MHEIKSIGFISDDEKGRAKVKEGQIRLLEEKLMATKMQYQVKLEFIELWRVQMKAKLQINENEEIAPVKDEKYIESIINELGSSIKNKQQFEETLRLYLQKAKDREQKIQKIVAKDENLKSHQDDLMEEKKIEDKKLQELDQESIALKNSYTTAILNEKTLEKLKKEKEDDLFTGGQKNEQIFSGVQKSLGTKAAQKIKKEHKKEISELEIAQQVHRRRAMRYAHSTIKRISKLIESKDIENYTVSQINSVIIFNLLYFNSSRVFVPKKKAN